jgi:NHL repeat
MSMRIALRRHCAFGMLISAVLSGCGGSPAVPASYSPDLRLQVIPQAKNPNLVYVSDSEAATVSVYSWPGKLLGTLTGFTRPAGLCSDPNGNVFVTDYEASDIVEYAHNGAFPIRTLKDPRERPIGCAVDPVTGNLAVTNQHGVSSGRGSISIYTKAKGRPKIYSDVSAASMDFCGYDDRGNLFADGLDAGSAFILVELQKGGTTLSTIKVNAQIGYPGAVQWDGKYLTIADLTADAIYRVVVSGFKAKVQGKTVLNGATGLAQSWIVGSKVIAVNFGGSPANVLIWNYPAGGAPTKSVGTFMQPFGVTVSVPPK